MKLKKFAALGMAALMVLSMAACGDSGSSSGASAGSGSGAASGSSGGSSFTATELVDDTTGLKIECEPIELSMGCSGTVEGTIMGDAIDKYTAELKEWTDGNFVINFYPSGQLGGDTELIEGTQLGSVDIFTGSPSSQIGLIPELSVLDISGLFETVEECNEVLDQFYDQIEPYYNNAGLHLLGLKTFDFRITSSNDPIESLADLKGLNIRTQENKYHMTFWQKLGANPTPLAFGELYIALQQGMMDAQENPWASYVGARLCEVQNYMTLTNHIPFVQTYVMNNAKYESLSDAQKQALNQFIYSAQKYQLEGTTADDERMMQECIDDYGLVVNEVPDDVKAAYADATQAVVDQMKGDIDSAFVDQYMEMVHSVTGR